jgi:hypothetical protein
MALSRRDFLKLAALGLGALAFRPLARILPLESFPQSEYLGRVCSGGRLYLRSQPNVNAPAVREIYEDAVFAWGREVNATSPDLNRYNQRWVETPEGYIYASDVQKVQNRPNVPLTALPPGKVGFWAEVTVPYVDFALEGAPASPWLKERMGWGLPTRLYYSQVVWIDQIKPGEGSGAILYRVNERYGSYGDLLWAEGAAFRPLMEEEVAPISPDVDPNEKTVLVNLAAQTLSCFEGRAEVYFCRISSGATASTPIGEYRTWRKTVSMHMAGGTVGGGWDTPAVAWTVLFAGTGIALHSTFWHNDYGTPRSHGCVNMRPEDAKWVYRWTTPQVPFDEGDVTVGMPGGTIVRVVEKIF